MDRGVLGYSYLEISSKAQSSASIAIWSVKSFLRMRIRTAPWARKASQTLREETQWVTFRSYLERFLLRRTQTGSRPIRDGSGPPFVHLSF